MERHECEGESGVVGDVEGGDSLASKASVAGMSTRKQDGWEQNVKERG